MLNPAVILVPVGVFMFQFFLYCVNFVTLSCFTTAFTPLCSAIRPFGCKSINIKSVSNHCHNWASPVKF